MRGLLNYALGEHQQNRYSETPNSFLRAIIYGTFCRLCCTRRTTGLSGARGFASVERGDITIFLPWLMGYTRRASARCRDPAHEAKVKRASSACHDPEGVTVAVLSLPTESRAPGREATWGLVKPKFPGEDQTSVSEAAVAAVVASASDSEEGAVRSDAGRKGSTLRSPLRS